MVNWSDPAVIEEDETALGKLGLVLLGIYGWEYLLTLQAEWALISRRLTFRWPLVPYFLGRYSFLATVISL
ncbi:hypothetical protein SERLADRAFT_443134 [Serpula lacrymans var. lacrymans S7.9]|nr:uncharacterized protein SERLADRAFT_443134 [Serpula lacrymans var. lacrymans S7.9]EGO19666.1 hypothetical protein SERLADRAFT_443134 [Serpula lacrymans var. lacrymans S7.9]